MERKKKKMGKPFSQSLAMQVRMKGMKMIEIMVMTLETNNRREREKGKVKGGKRSKGKKSEKGS